MQQDLVGHAPPRCRELVITCPVLPLNCTQTARAMWLAVKLRLLVSSGFPCTSLGNMNAARAIGLGYTEYDRPVATFASGRNGLLVSITPRYVSCTSRHAIESPDQVSALIAKKGSMLSPSSRLVLHEGGRRSPRAWPGLSIPSPAGLFGTKPRQDAAGDSGDLLDLQGFGP